MRARVLVVDDDLDIRQALGEALESEGYEVVQARDGADALRAAHEHVPDIILLDLMMPVMNAWAFRAAQKADRTLASVPVVVVSAVDSDRLTDLDADAYISKPFMLEELFATVARVERDAASGQGRREPDAEAPGTHHR